MVKRLSIMLMFFLTMPAFAGEISVQPDRNPVAMNETFQLLFTVKGSQDGEPDFSPLNEKFELLGTSTSSQFSVVNSRVSQSKEYTLTLAAKETGELTIPEINFGKDRSPATPISINQQGSSSSTPADSNTDAAPGRTLFIELEADSITPYVQQQVLLRLKIYRRIEWAGATLSDLTTDGADTLVQSIGDEKRYTLTRDGKKYSVTEINYALFPQQSGTLTINPFTLVAKIPSSKTRSRPSGSKNYNDPLFDNFFSRRSYDQRRVRSNALKLDVKPIPASFTGQLWLPAKQFKLQQSWSIDERSLTSGEPITRTITITASGLGSSQLPEIEIEAQADLKIYPDQATLDDQLDKQGVFSTRVQKFALIPSRSGNLELPAIEIPWWNVETNQQEMARLDSASFEVAASTVSEPIRQMKVATDTPVIQTSKNQPTTETLLPRWLIGSNVILLILWLITLIAWWKAKQHIAKTDNRKLPEDKNKPENVRKALRKLQSACKTTDASAIRAALLNWGQSLWVESPPGNIGDIAPRVQAALAEQIDKLNQQLYGASEKTWDAGKIATEAATYTASHRNTASTKPQVLEPLYR